MSNRLAGENSPYLLQHAENPVDWYPWGEQALKRARDEDKPIFLSIGYAACHWCHVMAHEFFEDAGTAAILNDNFVCIKVDREERPDLDAIYMQATTSMTGSGGWPMSVFLTPDLRPFYAGTYFPPVRTLQHARLLRTCCWRSPGHGSKTGHRSSMSRAGCGWSSSGRASVAETWQPSAELLTRAEAALVEGADRQNGGWGPAPKFPQPMSIEFLLRRAALDPAGHRAGLNVAIETLRLMSRGGMYDVVGGGFARYSTDEQWLVPHFEKMLYDNAQLALVYLQAYLLTGDAAFKQVATETLDFVSRELMHPDGGFLSSLDADSEGSEGRYYAWSEVEIRDCLPDPATFDVFAAAYGLTSRGNWEGRIVLQRALDDATLGARFNLPTEAGGTVPRPQPLHALRCS